MKTLVIYFSVTGNNRLLADCLADKLGCEAYPVVEQKHRTSLTNILDVLFNREPKLAPLPVNLADYDPLILVAPIWNGKPANPMSALVRQEREAIGRYSFASLCSYHRPGQKQSITAHLRGLAGQRPEVVAEFALGDLVTEEDANDVMVVSRQLAREEDMIAFDRDIDDFLRRAVPGLPPSKPNRKQVSRLVP